MSLKILAKRKHLIKCLQDSYYQDKEYLEDVVCDCKGQKLVLSRRICGAW